MIPMIVKLQQMAQDDKIPVATLLRNALVVATKLGLEDFKNWVNFELEGYADDVPDYRRTNSRLMSWNMYTGWQPVQFEDAEVGEVFSKRGTTQPVSELEGLVRDRERKTALQMPLPYSVQKMLSEGTGFETQYTVFTDRASILRILDTVRTIILKWSLKLEETQVVGENMSFTPEEKRAAESVPQNLAFYAPVTIQYGDQSSSTTVTVGTIDVRKVETFIDTLAESIGQIDELDNKEEMEADIATIKSQAQSPKPKWGIIKAALGSLRRSLEAATGNAVADELLEQISMLF